MRTRIPWLLPALVLWTGGCSATPVARTRPKASFGGGASSARVAMDDWGGKLVGIPVTVNGVSADALLDTGATRSVLEKAFAEGLQVPLGGRCFASGVAGRQTGRTASGLRLAVGDFRLDGLEVWVLDLSHAEDIVGRRVPVVLGEDLFAQAVVEVDPAAHVVGIHDPERFAPPPGALRVALTETGGFRLLEVSLEGGPPVPVLLDLGSAAPITLHPDYWRTHLPLGDRAVSTTLGTGVGGSREAGKCTLSSLGIAGVTLTGVPADLETERPTRLPAGASGFLGFPVLSRFHFFVDYPHQALWLVPDRASIAAPFSKDRLGLALLREGEAARILLVAGGSPAAAAGFRVGDLLTAIDGKPAGSWAQKDLRGLGARPAGTALTLTTSDGSQRRVVLKDYY